MIKNISLSVRMRPNKLEDFIGQKHFLYENSLFYNAIKNKNFTSAIFYGPSGSGKTTLARIIAKEMDGEFVELNGANSGIKEIKEVIFQAEDRLYGFEQKSTYVYIDEIHRWNKLQQDYLLRPLEEGSIRLIGSTTENPYFAINNAILSRVRHIYEFYNHSEQEIEEIIIRAIQDDVLGLGNKKIEYDISALKLLSTMCSGDARIALDTIEYIWNNLGEREKVTEDVIKEALQQQIIFYSRDEEKFNLLSALQKSIRGSDPDASIHYLARLIISGADLQMISRRLLVIASEDIGLAYPQAISIVNSCVQAGLMVGLPEAEINLAQAVILLATSPKSNKSYEALLQAKEDLKTINVDDVPLHLKDAHYKGAKARGIGGYLYPHSYGGYVKQQYLPDNLHNMNKRYYIPSENGQETSFKKYLEAIEKIKRGK